MRKNIIRLVCTSLVGVILLYLLVLQVISLSQTLILSGDVAIKFSLLYSSLALLLLLALLGTTAVAFNFCPKRLASKRWTFDIVLYAVITAVVLCSVGFCLFTVVNNQNTLLSLNAEGIVDANNLLPEYIAKIKQNLVLCWCNFGAAVFSLAPLGVAFAAHRSQIKNRVNVEAR